jgi:hypothetical protein
MKRRTFLQAITAGISIPVVFNGVTKKDPKPAPSKWIAFMDQMPEDGQKFEMKNNRSEHIVKGHCLEFTDPTWNDKVKYIMYDKDVENGCMETINPKKWHWRYV